MKCNTVDSIYKCKLNAKLQKCGMTQQDVAAAIGASVRTYQKWESGETTPDCQNLIRIMNWLDIPDIQQLISHTHIR